MRVMVCVLGAAMAVSAFNEPRVRFGPGVCGPIDPAYIKTADATGGQPFPLSTAEVATSSRIMEASLLRDMLLWASADSERTYEVPVDATVERVMIAASFDATGGSLALTAPDGTVVQAGERVDDTTFGCGRIVTVDHPGAGTWHVHVRPTGRFWLVVHAKSELSLSGVALDGGGILRVSVSPAIAEPIFQLVTLDAQPLQVLDLQPADDGVLSGVIAAPSEPFRLLVTGVDASGNRVQRMWPALLRPIA